MSSINPARSFVILGAVVLALVLLAPQRVNASDFGYSLFWGGLILVEAVDLGVGIYDFQAASRNDRIGKRTAGLQLVLTVPQVVFGSLLIGAWGFGKEGAGIIGGLAGFALTAIPLAVAVYSIYVLLSPEPTARLSARLEKGIGIELPAPRVAGIERVMLTPTVMTSPQPGGPTTPKAFKTDNSAGSLQLAPGVALAFRF
jgi:hypothetical protein